jgi:hypothetical protein
LDALCYFFLFQSTPEELYALSQSTKDGEFTLKVFTKIMDFGVATQSVILGLNILKKVKKSEIVGVSRDITVFRRAQAYLLLLFAALIVGFYLFNGFNSPVERLMF